MSDEGIIVAFSKEELEIASQKILDFYPECRIFCLEGDLGAGKTTLIESICHSLGSNEKHSSPTFSIVNEYSYSQGIIYHMDWYRLKSIEEALDIGVEDMLFSGEYCFIEWHDKAESLIPRPYILISIQTLDENTRYLTTKRIE